MFQPHAFQAIADLDLEPIKVKLMHKPSGEGWNLERANAAEFEYRRFLYLMKRYPGEPTAPGVDVDTFWHYHILDTLKYATDCDKVFGYFLHHFPYIGMRGEDDEQAQAAAGARLRDLYQEEFGEAASAQADAFCGAAAPNQAIAFCGAATPQQATAFCGAAAPNQATAFCGAAAPAAFCGAAAPGSASLSTERPRLNHHA